MEYPVALSMESKHQRLRILLQLHGLSLQQSKTRYQVLPHVKPQISEDIEKAVWMTMHQFLSNRRQVYPNILDVVHTQDTQELVSKVEIKIN